MFHPFQCTWGTKIVYEVHRRLRPGAALTEAVRCHNNEAAVFAEYAASLPSFSAAEDAEVRRYVEVLESMMRATLEWTLGSMRYGGSLQLTAMAG